MRPLESDIGRGEYGAVMRSTVAAVLMMSAIVAPSFAGPIGNLPSGWVYLQRTQIDSMRGLYHDAISGALVQFDIGPARIVGDGASSSPRGTASRGRTGNGVPYVLATGKDAKAEALAEVGKDFKEATKDEYDVLPPEGCSLVAVSFEPTPQKGAEYRRNFWSDICDERQSTRVRELLLGAPTLSPNPEDDTLVGSARLSVKDVDALVTGASLRDILAKHGQPFDSWRWTKEGVVVVYGLDDGVGSIKLRFDRKQRLVSKERL
jgi:hypothetical protein